MMIPVLLRALPVLVLLALPLSAAAQTANEPSPWDTAWRNFSQWYADDTNPFVQSVVFSGRYQHDFLVLNADQGDHNEQNVRRLRLGPRVRLFRTFLLHAEADLNPQEGPFYLRITDAYLQWSRSARLVVTGGKHGAPFTLDGATSSKDLLTIDRNNLTNNLWFTEEYMTGASVSGRVAPWTYRAGVFSSGSRDKGFGGFDGGMFTLLTAGYDFGPRLGANEATLAANYVYQQEDPDNTFTRPFDHVLSVNFKLEQDRWGVRADLATGSGYGSQSDLWGLAVMPYRSLTDKLQVVGRYTLLRSDAPNGVRLATYENRVVGGRGDSYNEGYVGANYFIYGHKLKLQTGVQFADMADRANDGGAYSGISWTTGLRVGWP